MRLATVKKIGPSPIFSILKAYKFFNAKAGLFNNSAQSSFSNISSRMVRDNGTPMSAGVIPDFVASFSVPVKNKTCFSKFMNNFTRLQRRKGSHTSMGTGIFRSNFLWGDGSEIVTLAMGSPCSIQDSTILRATSSAISMTSAMVLPWAINPCSTELVAKYPPSANGSIEIGIKYSDILSPLDKIYHRNRYLSRVPLAHSRYAKNRDSDHLSGERVSRLIGKLEN